MTLEAIQRLGETHHPSRTKNLEILLKQAADMHHAYEKVLGHHDADWAKWYAEWMEPHLEELFK